MKFRKLAVAMVAGGSLALATAGPALAQNSPYPPGPCAGQTGPGVINTTVTTPGGTITFTACGFQSGTVVVISLNGGAFTIVIASLKGTVTVPVTPTKPGRNTIQAVGLRPGAQHANLPWMKNGWKGLRGLKGASAASVAKALPASYRATDLRTVSAGFDVAQPAVAAHVTTPVRNAGLSLSGGEAGVIGASALAFAGSGVGLRMAARRRRSAGNPPSVL